MRKWNIKQGNEFQSEFLFYNKLIIDKIAHELAHSKLAARGECNLSLDYENNLDFKVWWTKLWANELIAILRCLFLKHLFCANTFNDIYMHVRCEELECVTNKYLKHYTTVNIRQC